MSVYFVNAVITAAFGASVAWIAYERGYRQGRADQTGSVSDAG